MWPFHKKLSKQERSSLKQLHQLEGALQFLTGEVKNNTALVPKGQQFAGQLEALTQLITNRKQAYLASVLNKMGIQKAQVNIFNGVITPLPPDVAPVNREAPQK